jgi:flagellar hook-basal body complex protein FliE
MPTPLTAATAYSNLAKLTDPGRVLSKTVGDPTSEGPSFASLVKQALGTVVDAGKKADAQTQAMVAGKGDMVDLVTAVAESETAITTLVSVRDRMIQAYQQIMQMPI